MTRTWPSLHHYACRWRSTWRCYNIGSHRVQCHFAYVLYVAPLAVCDYELLLLTTLRHSKGRPNINRTVFRVLTKLFGFVFRLLAKWFMDHSAETIYQQMPSMLGFPHIFKSFVFMLQHVRLGCKLLGTQPAGVWINAWAALPTQ